MNIKIDDHEAWLVTEIFDRVLNAHDEVDMFEGDRELRKECDEFYKDLLKRRGFGLYKKENELWGV